MNEFFYQRAEVDFSAKYLVGSRLVGLSDDNSDYDYLKFVESPCFMRDSACDLHCKTVDAFVNFCNLSLTIDSFAYIQQFNSVWQVDYRLQPPTFPFHYDFLHFVEPYKKYVHFILGNRLFDYRPQCFVQPKSWWNIVAASFFVSNQSPFFSEEQKTILKTVKRQELSFFECKRLITNLL